MKAQMDTAVPVGMGINVHPFVFVFAFSCSPSRVRLLVLAIEYTVERTVAMFKIFTWFLQLASGTRIRMSTGVGLFSAKQNQKEVPLSVSDGQASERRTGCAPLCPCP